MAEHLSPKVERFAQHRNSFGFLRLLFASLVIVAHTPELVDGDRSREPLTMLFGTMTFGDFAVDGFFLVSGYLITGSWLSNPQVWPYLRKRIARIYPAFIVCAVLAVLIVAPLAGSTPEAVSASLFTNIRNALFLKGPVVDGAFASMPHPALNGAVWTIPYEFQCYLLVVALGLLSVFRKPWAVAGLAAVLYAGFLVVPAETRLQIPHLPDVFGRLDQILRLASIFLVGALFYLKRDAVTFTKTRVAVSILGLGVCLSLAPLAHLGMALFGGYLTFATAAHGKGVLTTINNRNDVSYGLYLYAWPIEMLLIRYAPGMSLWFYAGATWLLSYAAGWASWLVIEKPALEQFAGKKKDVPSKAVPAAA